jgi:hypothetical protein
VAASKAELESAWQCYDNAVQRAEIALAGRKHMKAIEFAVSAWPFIDGMIQYSKSYLDGGQFESLGHSKSYSRTLPSPLIRSPLTRWKPC